MISATRSRTWRRLLVSVAAVALVAAACGDDDDDDDAAESGTDTTVAESTEGTGATGDTGGGEAVDLSGETVNVQGTEVGSEGESAQAGFVPLEESTGVDVVFSGSRDFETNVRVAAEAGNLPDIGIFPQPAGALSLADSVTPLPDDIVATLNTDYDPLWASLVTTDDGSVLGVPVKADVKSLVWYSPAVFEENGYEIPTTWDDLMALTDQAREDGIAPWCIGIESGEATGWPFTDWMEDIMLRLHGPDVYDQWTNHEIPFNDPRVLEVVELIGDIWFTDGNVLGGRESIASTGFGAAGLPVLEGDCLMHRQGNFFSANFLDFDPDVTFGEDGDVNVFYLPTMSDEFGDVVLVAGGYAVAFNDRAATLETLRYMATPAYPDARNATGLGGYLSPNRLHDTSLYTSDLDRTFAEILVTADPVRFDASDLMPTEVGSGSLWSGATDYVSGTIDAQEFVDRVEESWPTD
jgi:alpha-glucoside transport system substrate-binding protein